MRAFLSFQYLCSLCFLRKVLGALGLMFAAANVDAAAPAMLEVQIYAAGQPIRMNQLGQFADKQARAIAVSRLDLLLSEFSLQRKDGSWTRAQNWYGFFRAEQSARRQPLPHVPPGDYVAVRFALGVEPKANHADPSKLHPEHPLHPVVNGLHWGWTGGYIFMALEGHWQPDNAPAGSTGGFSYHFAGDENLVSVSFPVQLQVRAGTVLRLNFDAARLLSRLDISRDGDSTHSRQQDAILRAYKAALASAFSLQNDAPQPPVVSTSSSPIAGPHKINGPSRAYAFATDAHMPSVTLPPDNPLTVDGVALGELLFNDRRLSIDNSVSCASCHRRAGAFSDSGKVLSLGVDGRQGSRNAMPLFNLAWVNEFFWDGRSQRLNQQVLEPIQHPNEMAETLPRVVAKLSGDRQLVEQFKRAFGDLPGSSIGGSRGASKSGAVNAQRIGWAIEQYLLSIVSQDSKFDRVKKGAEQFSTQEKRGLELFLTEHDPANGQFGADCFHCHSGALFTNNRFANNGLPVRGNDTGREHITRDVADRGKFRTPSLRNVAISGPYMHDGRFVSLEEVIEHYDRGVERSPSLDPNLAKHPKAGLRLSKGDKAALVAFLRTLTDSSFVGPQRTAQLRRQR